MLASFRTGQLSVGAIRFAATRLARRPEALVVSDQALVSAGNFILTACMTRLLSLSDFGQYMLIMSVDTELARGKLGGAERDDVVIGDKCVAKLQ